MMGLCFSIVSIVMPMLQHHPLCETTWHKIAAFTEGKNSYGVLNKRLKFLNRIKCVYTGCVDNKNSAITVIYCLIFY